jgi:hypothetical protein
MLNKKEEESAASPQTPPLSQIAAIGGKKTAWKQ